MCCDAQSEIGERKIVMPLLWVGTGVYLTSHWTGEWPWIVGYYKKHHKLFLVDAYSVPTLMCTPSGSYVIYVYFNKASVHPPYNTIWLSSELSNNIGKYQVHH